MKTDQPPIKIRLFGMDQRSRKIVKMTIEQKISQFCQVVDDLSAEVALIDMDSANHQGEMDLLFRTHKNIPIIALSIKPIESENLHFLRKPLSLQNLLELIQIILSEKNIKKAAGDGVSTIVGSKYTNMNISQNKKQKTGAIADVLDTRVHAGKNCGASYSAPDDLFFDPQKYTLAFVKNAIDKSEKTGKQIVIEIWDGKTILIDAEYGKILTDISHGQMRTLGVIAVNQHNTKIKIKTANAATKFDFDPQFNSSIRVTKIDDFVWQLAFITSRGRLPDLLDNDKALNLEHPVYINEWPNFTRLAPIPHAIRIIAFWIQQPISLCKLAQLLNVDGEFINGLFFACHSIGIAGQATRQADKIMEPTLTTKHKHRSLFGALLGHLKGRK